MNMLLQLSAGLFSLASAALAFELPPPTGRYNVSLTLGALSDYSREDPDPAISGPRRLMLSVFEPTPCRSTVPVENMPDEVADFQGPFLQTILDTTLDVTPLFRESRLPVCPDPATSCSRAKDYPILLLSPGYSIPRLYYNYIASAIASEGFLVISIDHPGDTNFILYPDNTTSINNDTVQGFPLIRPKLRPRVADVSFLLDQLTNATAVAELLPHRGPRPFTTKDIGMLGHSLGGIAAVIAAEDEPRLKCAINWDGYMLEIPTTGVSQPTLLISGGNLFDSWDETWPHLEGPKLWIDLSNVTHFSFSDGATLFKAAGEDLADHEELLGKIAPTEMIKLLLDYSLGWARNSFMKKDKQQWDEVKDLEFKEATIHKVGNL